MTSETLKALRRIAREATIFTLLGPIATAALVFILALFGIGTQPPRHGTASIKHITSAGPVPSAPTAWDANGNPVPRAQQPAPRYLSTDPNAGTPVQQQPGYSTLPPGYTIEQPQSQNLPPGFVPDAPQQAQAAQPPAQTGGQNDFWPDFWVYTLMWGWVLGFMTWMAYRVVRFAIKG